MNSGIKVFLVGALAMAAMLFGATLARAAEPGDWYKFTAYCVTEEDARLLSEQASANGDVGYRAVLMDPDTSCVLAGYHRGINPIEVVLVELKWTMTNENGKQFEFWQLRDRVGNEAYGWLLVPEEDV